jgi:tripartite-type tricarboxylate transporter receptor subunit TctC
MRALLLRLLDQQVHEPFDRHGLEACRVNQEAVQFLNIAATRERLLGSGVESIGSTPEELADTVKSEILRMAKLIKDAGVRTEQ